MIINQLLASLTVQFSMIEQNTEIDHFIKEILN